MSSSRSLLCAWRAVPLFLCTLAVIAAPGCSSSSESAAGREGATEAEPEGAGGAEEAAPEETAPAEAASATRMEEGFFMAEGAPDPRACSADADCVGDTVPAASGCCQAHHPIRAHSRAYTSWVGTWRAAHCDGVTCPPPPAPSQPDECSFTVRCEAGQCRDACP